MNKEIQALKDLLALEKNNNPHLDSDLGANRYIKKADKIKSYLPNGKILDWGCGLGQMSYLLKNRGFDVVSYDLDQGGRSFLERIGQKLILAADKVKLPFQDISFDAVLSSGVLEHVAEPPASLKEVDRILKPGGYFFVFMLPNKYSCIEFISDFLGRGDHPIKFTRKQIIQMLNQQGFEIISLGFKGFLPYNLKGFPDFIRNLYHRLDPWLEKIDHLLSTLPLINNLSTNIELVARKIK